MRRKGRHLLWLGIAVLPLACGSNRHVDMPARESADPAERIEGPVTSEPELEVHRGTLDKTVEVGGWLLKTTGKDYLLLSISSYRQESWFRAGESIEVEGRVAPDAMTIYMQGVPFRVSAMRPLEREGQRHR